jgi:uncharacterized protein
VGSVSAARVTRTDAGVGRLGKFARNGAGAVRVPATISRTGLQTYPGEGPGGSELIEYRPAEEVFSADSLASLAGVPVTLRHPSGARVSPENARGLTIGHASDLPAEAGVKVDGSSDEWVRHQLYIADGDVQSSLERGDAGGISCGYSCRLDMTPGVTPDGRPYHAVQRDIRYNHVAVLTTDQPRAGAPAKVRLDSKDPNNMKKIVIDGVELEYGSAEHFAHIAKAHQNALDAAKAREDALQAKLDAMQAKHDAEKSRADSAVAATSAERIDAAVAARMALFASAARLLPADYDTKGKSDAQVRADAVAHALGGADKIAGKSEAYIEARFDTLVEAKAPTAPAQYHAPVRSDSAPVANINDSDDAFRASLAAQKVSK